MQQYQLILKQLQQQIIQLIHLLILLKFNINKIPAGTKIYAKYPSSYISKPTVALSVSTSHKTSPAVI